jgi:hypothetical protein
MKKTILLITVLFLTFISCSKDDSPTVVEPINNFINTKWEFTNTQGFYMSFEFINETECKMTIDLPFFSPDYFFYNYTYLDNKATIIKKDNGETRNTCKINGNTMTISTRSDEFHRVN